MAVDARLTLASHPDLNVVRVTEGKTALTLIGFMLDPEWPDRSDAQILKDLLAGLDRVEHLFMRTSRLGGRWALIATTPHQAVLFHDAVGLRQVCYAQDENGRVFAGSQPKLIAEVLGLHVSEESARFMDTYSFRRDREYWWPGDTTPYREVRQLLPNHCLDLTTGRARRFWPWGPIPSVPPVLAAQKIAARMRGVLAAATARYEVAIGVTAGLDSRLVLAASKDVRDRVHYFSLRQATMPDTAADIAVPSQLLSGLGIAHETVRAPASMSAEFSEYFKRHVFLAHDHYGADAEAILNHYRRRYLVVTGSAAEIGRSPYLEHFPRQSRRVSAAYLAHVKHYSGNEFVVDGFGRWLSGLGNIYNTTVTELFEWEQEHGRWLATTQLEFDTAWREIVSAYNSRDVLVMLLGVPERYRVAPRYRLFRQMIEHLWPEVLAEPINPHREQRLAGVKRALARFRAPLRIHLLTR